MQSHSDVLFSTRSELCATALRRLGVKSAPEIGLYGMGTVAKFAKLFVSGLIFPTCDVHSSSPGFRARGWLC